ncbi:hypothetical protein [Thalassorhabdomicrobium marinisediminis]|uniref:DUF7742 domain-containing protein n=1 Tax=Thalassorhabdomicrobium marinisediminis TaxID=2170577 RepID=A0A2T7G0W4_9RHOB|nr:hypothetical protein [Thalassorhabdomicrobium marinisediminis]PVA08066.1 hypothetical protein DC363_00770 [Thalassorhabdomicrobium marinisediminis]
MRQVGWSDLDMAARALLARPPAERPRAARAMIEAAHVADLWRKRFGTAHPGGGTGSLHAEACLHARRAARPGSPEYCAALAQVLAALAAWRARLHDDL